MLQSSRSPLEQIWPNLTVTYVIVLASVLAPTIAEYTGEGGALAEYSAILGAVMLMAIVGILMVAVRLITNKN